MQRLAALLFCVACNLATALSPDTTVLGEFDVLPASGRAVLPATESGSGQRVNIDQPVIFEKTPPAKALHLAQVSAEKSSSASSSAAPDGQVSGVISPHQVTHKTTDSGDLPEKKVWPHRLPLMGQKVIDRGYLLPRPYGIALIYAGVEQDVDLSDLRVGINGSPQVDIDNFTTFETSTADNHSVQLKFDFFLFPFLNVFGIVGKVEGTAYVPIGILGEDLLKAAVPDIGARCDRPAGTPLRPAACDKDFFVLDNSHYDGYTYGGGFVLAGGWKHFFAALPVSYVYSSLSNADNKITALDITPRVGVHASLGRAGVIAPYIGATYLDTQQDISGSLVIDLGDSNPEVPDSIEFDYTIQQKGSNPWNYLVGFNWMITSRWWLQGELGFGNTRDDFITSVSYRW